MSDEIRDLESLDGVEELYEAIEEVTKEEAENTDSEPIVNADYEIYEEEDEDNNVDVETDTADANVHISSDVICKIAEIAATEIKGVAAMYNGIVGDIAERIGERLGTKKLLNKSVKIQMDGRNVTIDVYISIEYGAIMLDVASDVQENIKNNVETMTGLNVTDVNVHIAGVSFTKKENAVEDDAVIEIDED